jgi:hypothetical protein
LYKAIVLALYQHSSLPCGFRGCGARNPKRAVSVQADRAGIEAILAFVVEYFVSVNAYVSRRFIAGVQAFSVGARNRIALFATWQNDSFGLGAGCASSQNQRQTKSEKSYHEVLLRITGIKK